MSDWKEMAKRLNENQQRNLKNYAEQDFQANIRIKSIEELNRQTSEALSRARRKRSFEITPDSKGFDR